MTDVPAPWRDHDAGRTAKPGEPDESPAKASWREVKDTPPPPYPSSHTGPSAFKDAAISECSSSESEGAWPFSPPAEPQCLLLPLREEEVRKA